MEAWRRLSDDASMRGERIPEWAADLQRVNATGDPLALVAFWADTERVSEELLRKVVASARSAGRTWEQIGAALGTSRQAAWLRFHKDDQAGGGQGVGL